MAYITEIEVTCDAVGCANKATVSLWDFNHHLVGNYCLAHGQTIGQSQQALEDEARKPPKTMPLLVTR